MFSTIFIILIFFLLGLASGTAFYHFIQDAISLKINKKLEQNISRYDKLIQKNLDEQIIFLANTRQNLKNKIQDIKDEQNTLIAVIKFVENKLITFHNELESYHQIHQDQEAEIIKLKSILKRKSKPKVPNK